MTEQIIRDVIAFFGVVTVTIGGYYKVKFDKKQSVKLKEVHSQIRNDHPNKPNIRDDIDSLASSLAKGLENIRGDIRGVHKDIAGLHGAVGGVRRELHTEIERSTRADDRLNRRLDQIDPQH